MPERKPSTNTHVEDYSRLDYNSAVTSAKRRLTPLELDPKEKMQMLIAVSATLFPQRTSRTNGNSKTNKDSLQSTMATVLGSPQLCRPFIDIVTDFASFPAEIDVICGRVTYENTWERQGKPIPMPEAQRRTLIVLEEHHLRYTHIPVNMTSLGQAIGGLSKQRMHQIWIKLKNADKIPGYINVLPEGAQLRPQLV